MKKVAAKAILVVSTLVILASVAFMFSFDSGNLP